MTEVNNLFEETGSDKKPDNDIIALFADKLMAIKKDDGTPKYDSIDKALDALKASQDHITRLENEARDREQKVAELAKEAEKKTELEKLLQRMTEGNNSEKPIEVTPPTGGLSEKDAADLVKRILSERDQQTTAVENLRNVNDKLISKYGTVEAAKEVVENKAKELGIPLEKFKELSATSPSLVLSLFGENSLPNNPISNSYRLPNNQTVEELKRPEKSLLSGSGANDKARAEFMAKVRDKIYKKYDITP